MTIRNLGRPLRRHEGRHGDRGGYTVGWVFEPADFHSSLDHLVVLEIEPGGEVGEHLHEDDDEIYVVLSGRGVMDLDGVAHAVRKGDAILTGPGHRHSLRNDGQEALKVIVVNSKAGAEPPLRSGG